MRLKHLLSGLLVAFAFVFFAVPASAIVPGESGDGAYTYDSPADGSGQSHTADVEPMEVSLTCPACTSTPTSLCKTHLPQSSKLVAPNSGSLSGSALANAGRGAEDLVSARIGVPRNAGTGRVTVPGSGAGGFRVPDFNPFGSSGTIATRGTVVEVKNVAQLSSSAQLRDLVGIAQIQGVPLEIFTNAAALPRSGQLFDWIQSGQVIISPL